MSCRLPGLPCLAGCLVIMLSVCGSASVAGDRPGPGKLVFSHLGIYTAEKKPHMHNVAGGRVWVSDFRKDPFHIEWLWRDSERPAAGPLPEPHVAYRVEKIETAAEGLKAMGKPFDPGLFDIARVSFFRTDDGAAVELMEFKKVVPPDSAGGQPAVPRMVFSHVGMITTETKPGEEFVARDRVWVTDYRKHPYRVQWLRFEPDSPITGPLRNLPHVAYEVENIEAVAKGMKVLREPLGPGMFGAARAGFYQADCGAVVELIEPGHVASRKR